MNNDGVVREVSVFLAANVANLHTVLHFLRAWNNRESLTNGIKIEHWHVLLKVFQKINLSTKKVGRMLLTCRGLNDAKL